MTGDMMIRATACVDVLTSYRLAEVPAEIEHMVHRDTAVAISPRLEALRGFVDQQVLYAKQ